MTTRWDCGLVAAIAIALASPALPVIGNPTNAAMLVLLAMLAWRARGRELVEFAYVLTLLVALVSLSTVVGAIVAGGSHVVNPNAFGPYLRMAVCFFAIRTANDGAEVQRALLWLGAAASAFAVLQYYSPAVAEFTANHYLAEERRSVFAEEFEVAIVRVIGLYENPSSVALLAIAMMLVALHAHARQHIDRTTLLLFIVLHVVAGLLSLSKIFFAGLPLVLWQLWVLRHRLWALLAVLAAAVGAAALYALDHPLAEVVKYALSASVDADVALGGRYLKEQQEVIAGSLMFGYGLVDIPDVSINDSAYLLLAYKFGLFGSVVLALHLLWGLWSRREFLPPTLYLVLGGVLIAGIGANSIFGFRVDILLTAMFSLLCIEQSRSPAPNRLSVPC